MTGNLGLKNQLTTSQPKILCFKKSLNNKENLDSFQIIILKTTIYITVIMMIIFLLHQSRWSWLDPRSWLLIESENKERESYLYHQPHTLMPGSSDEISSRCLETDWDIIDNQATPHIPLCFLCHATHCRLTLRELLFLLWNLTVS